MLLCRDISHHTWQACASTLRHLEFSNSESKHCDDDERFSFCCDTWHRHRKRSRCNQNNNKSRCCSRHSCCRSGIADYHFPELKRRPIDWDGKMWEGHQTCRFQEFGSKPSKPGIWLLFVAVFVHGVNVCPDTADRMNVSKAASWDHWMFLNKAGTQLPSSDFWTALEHPCFQRRIYRWRLRASTEAKRHAMFFSPEKLTSSSWTLSRKVTNILTKTATIVTPS